MIRPVVGSPLTTGINDIHYLKKSYLKFWPNPAREIITIAPGDINNSDSFYISVTDMQGRELLKVPYKENIDISSLHEGIYIIALRQKGRTEAYSRLVKID